MAHTTRSRRQRRNKALRDPALEKERTAALLIDPSWVPWEWLEDEEALSAVAQHIAQHDNMREG